VAAGAIGVEGLEVGWSIEDRFGLSFWDSLIVAAAHVAGGEVILTEDLQDGMEFDGVRVVDPFQTFCRRASLSRGGAPQRAQWFARSNRAPGRKESSSQPDGIWIFTGISLSVRPSR
jgi:hypothetical protein